MSKYRGKRSHDPKLTQQVNNGSGNNGLKSLRCIDHIVVSAKTEGQKKYIYEIEKNNIIFCIGPAGSGKTAIAIGMALQNLMSGKSVYKKIILMRPVKEACEEHVGYLPGSLDEKMIPWAAPLVDNMAVFIDQNQIKSLFESKMIDVIPLAYARGRSLNESFIILDEAQNCTPDQMLMVLTRIGQNSKLVINGDPGQNDLWRQPSGLLDAVQRLNGMLGVSIVKLDEKDVVRNPMISEIIKRYSGYDYDLPVVENFSKR